jgi:glycosyltransferase involved in cell wall biosynthesis
MGGSAQRTRCAGPPATEGGAELKILMASRGVVPIKAGCGGAELVSYELARFFAREGHTVTVVSDVGDAERSSTPNLEFIPVERRIQRLVMGLPGCFFTWMLQHLFGNIAVAAKVRSLTREREFDVIHAHGNLSTALISFTSRPALVYTEHDAPPWQCRYRRWWERWIRRAIYRALNVTAFRRADHVIATFEALRDEIVQRWGVAESRVSVIANGADGHFFDPTGSWECKFDRYCLFVGRLTPRKGPDYVVRALAEAEDDVCCVFAGDGPMRREIERLAEKLGVADRIAFLGNVDPDSLAPLYANADLLVLPSVSEASPLVAAEAMACGTPVLATRIAGLPSLIEDWETGFLVHPDNVGEFAVALRFLMRDSRLRRRMSEKARRKAGERFVWSRLGRQFEAIYASLVPTSEERRTTSADVPQGALSRRSRAPRFRQPRADREAAAGERRQERQPA